MSITKLMQEFVKVREQLEAHGIRDTGQYAELLVCSALAAERNRSGVEKGFDIRCSTYGRVAVRLRTLLEGWKKRNTSGGTEGENWSFRLFCRHSL